MTAPQPRPNPPAPAPAPAQASSLVIATPIHVPGMRVGGQRPSRRIDAWTTVAAIDLELPTSPTATAATARPAPQSEEPYEICVVSKKLKIEDVLEDGWELIDVSPSEGTIDWDAMEPEVPTAEESAPPAAQPATPPGDDTLRMLGLMLPPLSDTGLCIRWTLQDGALRCSLLFQEFTYDPTTTEQAKRHLGPRSRQLGELLLANAPTHPRDLRNASADPLLARSIQWVGEFGYRTPGTPGLACSACDQSPGHCPADLGQILGRLRLLDGPVHLDVLVAPDFDLTPTATAKSTDENRARRFPARKQSAQGYRIGARLLCNQRPDSTLVRAIAESLPFCRITPDPLVREHRLDGDSAPLRESAAAGAPLGMNAPGLTGPPLDLQRVVACLPWPERGEAE